MGDCFAYRNKSCTILTIKKCEGPECVFYKTKEQFELDQEREQWREYSL